jgi:hypothetical protein
LLERQAPTAGPAAEETPEAPRVPAGAIWDEVFLLARNRTATPAPSEQLSWPEHWPYVAFPIAALVAMAATVALTARRRLRGVAVPAGVVPLNWFVIGCAAAWLLWKPAALALCERLPATGPEWQMLRAYLGFLLLRWELVLLFAGVCAAGCVLALFADQLRREGRILVRFGWWLGVVLTLWVATQRWPQCGDFIMPTARLFTTTPDDLALVAWCDENIPPERGLIGMAAATGRGGMRGEEKHLVGLRGMPAFLLHGTRGNYCFTLNSLEGTRWYDDYRSHVETNLDTAWCAANGIRYFYATSDGLRKNPGLDKAVKSGTLKLLHREGDSGVYEVVEEAR